ncbi:hypothetical protein ACHAWX_001326 [Stephanocyclus meneghinianus]
MPTNWVLERHRRFISDYLDHKKISLSTLVAQLKHRDKVKEPSSLDFMTKTAPPQMVKHYHGLDKQKLCYCLREMETTLIVDPMDFSLTSAKIDGMDYSMTSEAIDGMDFSLISDKTDGMDYTLTSNKTDGMDFSLTSKREDRTSKSMIGIDISVTTVDELVQRIGNLRFRDTASVSGDVSMASQSTSGYLPMHRYRYSKQRKECDSDARDVRANLKTINEKIQWA